jgi:xanthine dehydrogenase/oxidase
MAVQDACEILKKRLEPYYEKFKNEPFQKIAHAAYFDRVNLSAQGFYKTPRVGYTYSKDGKGTGMPFGYFTQGCAFSEVEIDCLTGDFQTIQSDIVMDVGDSINPKIDIGQIEGAFIQGLGLFTMENLIYGNKEEK